MTSSVHANRWATLAGRRIGGRRIHSYLGRHRPTAPRGGKNVTRSWSVAQHSLRLQFTSPAPNNSPSDRGSKIVAAFPATCTTTRPFGYADGPLNSAGHAGTGAAAI